MKCSCHDWNILHHSPNLLNSTLNCTSLVVAFLYRITQLDSDLINIKGVCRAATGYTKFDILMPYFLKTPISKMPNILPVWYQYFYCSFGICLFHGWGGSDKPYNLFVQKGLQYNTLHLVSWNVRLGRHWLLGVIFKDFTNSYKFAVLWIIESKYKT